MFSRVIRQQAITCSKNNPRARFHRNLLLGSTSVVSVCAYSTTCSVTFLERKKDPPSDESTTTRSKRDDNDDDSSSSSYSFFNIQDWNLGAKNSTEFWSKVLSETSNQQQQKQKQKQNKDVEKGNGEAAFSSLASNFMKLFGGRQDQQEQAITEIVSKVRETTNQSGGVSDQRSFRDLLDALNMYRGLIDQVADRYVSSIDFSKFDPTALFYYLEFEDERKNPSWKRRKHRFYDGIDIGDVEQLNDYLDLAKISYADTVDEIRQGLEEHASPCELIFAEVNSQPGKPANFVAVPRNQPKYSNQLEIIIGVRGTKSVADAITDLICEEVEYRGGKAHSFIVTGGKHIVEQHLDLMEELLEHSGKSKIRLRLVGHSLGAGAASIAAIEFNDHPKIDARVYGFGCPAILSKDLATNADYITTIVNDSDCVPRMSGITVANLLMDVMQFDWYTYAERDAQEAIEALHERQPFVFNKEMLNYVRNALTPHIKAMAERMVSEKTTDRGQVELFPPGKCIHIYRDGVGFAGSFVPNTFFSEIDLTRRMVDDHVFHSGYQQTFLELMRQHSGDHHFRFDDK